LADATDILNQISGALDGFATQVIGLIPDDRPINEIWGWNLPAMNRHDLADYFRSPIPLIQRVDPKSFSEEDIVKLSRYPGKFTYFRGNVIGNLPGGNAFHVYLEMISLIDPLVTILKRYDDQPFDLKALEDRKLLPAAQLKELKTIEVGIRRLGVESSDLERQVSEIKSAHTVAEGLPAHIQSLEDARERYDRSKKEIDDALAALKSSQQEVDRIRSSLQQREKEAAEIVTKASTAYSAATTLGLGAAFSDRADRLQRTTVYLGLLLVATLGLGAWITYNRVEFVHKLMVTPNISYNILWLNVTFTALSVSGPVWLAWLLTRQIGQRFRLAEDYAYKASVAKAYEGYRREAADIDEGLSKRLFAIALDRLGEAPLRLVEKDSPGSPMHEMRGPLNWVSRRGRRPEQAPHAVAGDEAIDRMAAE
jgi:hypothetical protein